MMIDVVAYLSISVIGGFLLGFGSLMDKPYLIGLGLALLCLTILSLSKIRRKYGRNFCAGFTRSVRRRIHRGIWRVCFAFLAIYHRFPVRHRGASPEWDRASAFEKLRAHIAAGVVCVCYFLLVGPDHTIKPPRVDRGGNRGHKVSRHLDSDESNP